MAELVRGAAESDADFYDRRQRAMNLPAAPQRAPGFAFRAPPEPPDPESRRLVGRSTADAALRRHKPDHTPGDLNAVLAVRHVSAVAVALDQASYRTDSALKERGYVPPEVAAANDDDLKNAERHIAVMEDALATMRGMHGTLVERLAGVPHSSDTLYLERARTMSDDPKGDEYDPRTTPPAEAPPDSPHGGLGKGKFEAIVNAQAGETGEHGVLDHAPTEAAGRKAAEDPRPTHAPADNPPATRGDQLVGGTPQAGEAPGQNPVPSPADPNAKSAGAAPAKPAGAAPAKPEPKPGETKK